MALNLGILVCKMGTTMSIGCGDKSLRNVKVVHECNRPCMTHISTSLYPWPVVGHHLPALWPGRRRDGRQGRCCPFCTSTATARCWAYPGSPASISRRPGLLSQLLQTFPGWVLSFLVAVSGWGKASKPFSQPRGPDHHLCPHPRSSKAWPPALLKINGSTPPKTTQVKALPHLPQPLHMGAMISL